MRKLLGTAGVALALAASAGLAQTPSRTPASVCDAAAAGQDTCALSGDHVLLQRQATRDKMMALDVAGRRGGPLVIQSGDEVLITAHTGRALTLENGILHGHASNRGSDDQIFIIEKDEGGEIRPGDRIFLKGHNGNYVTVDQDQEVHAQWANERGSWQQFVVEVNAGAAPIRDGDKIFLRTWSPDSSEHRITVMPEGDVEAEGAEVHAKWDHQGLWQELVIEKVKSEPEPQTTTTAPATTAPSSTTVTAATSTTASTTAFTTASTTESTMVVTTESATVSTTASTTTSTAAEGPCIKAYGKCGGVGWTGPSCCVEGFRCHDEHDYHHLCVPDDKKMPGHTTKRPHTTTQPEPETTTNTPTVTTTQPAPETTTGATATTTTASSTASATTQASSTTVTAATSTTTATTTTASSTASSTTQGAPTPIATSTAAPATTTTTTGGSRGPAPVDEAWIRGTWTTGYWDCCKPSCAWPGKGKVDKPIRSCSAGTSFPLEDPHEGSVCDGGAAVSCPNNAPWAYSSNLSFGFAAAAVNGGHGLAGDANCGHCFELRFTGARHPNGQHDPWGGAHPGLVGKAMVIQVSNIGGDVTGDHSFDLQIPGAGQGLFSNGCSAQFQGFEAGDFDCDNLYGGCHERGGCDRLPLELQAGCKWRYDWYHWLKSSGKTNNPFVDFRRVRCPPQIVAVSGSTPLDDADYPEISVDAYGETTQYFG